MKSEFRKTVEKLVGQAEDPNRQNCRRCETPTLLATLAQFGAMCTRCYEAYCSEAFAPRAVLADTADQRDMRKRLRNRAPGNVQRTEPVDVLVDVAKAQRETQRRVDEYQRTQGLAA